jgi:hypothetical protein
LESEVKAMMFWLLGGLVVLLVLKQQGKLGVFPSGGGDDVLDVLLEKIAYAIAVAEGFFVAGSLPQRRNNPGSLKGSDGQLRTFSTVEEGWTALKRQIRLILSDASRYYKSTMSVWEIAAIWTGGDKPEAWAGIVAGRLGIAPSETLLHVEVA